MADADQISGPENCDNPQPAPSGAESGGLVSQSEVVWILGDTLSNHDSSGDATNMHLPNASEADFNAAVFAEAPVNMDHALHQLTTATDLFEVPVLDFGDHHF